MEQLMAIERVGQFNHRTEKGGAKCGWLGRTHYQYKVRIEVEGDLNKDGFVVDNLEIQAWWERAFPHHAVPMPHGKSCEQMAAEACAAFTKIVRSRGYKVRKCVVGITGNNGISWIEAEVEHV